MTQKQQPKSIPLTRILIFATVGILAIIIIASAIVIVPAGYRGVHIRFGAVTGKLCDQGLHIVVPFVEGVEQLDIRTVKYEAAASSASKDLQTVSTTVALNYHLKPDAVIDIWQTLRREYQYRIIEPAIQESVKASTAKFNAEELITKRPLVKEEIENSLRVRLDEFGIALDTLSITNFEFSSQFATAIEQKVTAEQLKLKAEMDLQRIRVEKDQRIAEAQGKAEALRIEGEALKSNAKLVSLRWVEKWNGIMPQIVAGSGQQFIWDIGSGE